MKKTRVIYVLKMTITNPGEELEARFDTQIKAELVLRDILEDFKVCSGNTFDLHFDAVPMAGRRYEIDRLIYRQTIRVIDEIVVQPIMGKNKVTEE